MDGSAALVERLAQAAAPVAVRDCACSDVPQPVATALGPLVVRSLG
jgi:hypothetical protein